MKKIGATAPRTVSVQRIAPGENAMLLRMTLLVWLLGSGTVALADDPVDRVNIQQLRFEPRDETRSRNVPLKVYLTDDSDASPQPIVLFSHGLGGSRENSVYLAEHWAKAGYVAVFIQHIGSDDSVWKDVPLRERFAAMKNAASLKSSRDRISDVSFVINQLEAWNTETDHPLCGKLDLEWIGMSGHSFGSRTTAAVMGQRFPFNREFTESRLDAFLLLSPAVGRGHNAATAYGHIQVPVMCMTGSDDKSPLDPSVTPQSRREVYAAMPAGDKYELVFAGGTHMAFSDRPIRLREQRDPRIHPAIQQISTAFWDAYLKRDRQAKAWLQSARPRQDAGLSENDRWQWK
jgi:predicted dienelactone hydrolase